LRFPVPVLDNEKIYQCKILRRRIPSIIEQAAAQVGGVNSSLSQSVTGQAQSPLYQTMVNNIGETMSVSGGGANLYPLRIHKDDFELWKFTFRTSKHDYLSQKLADTELEGILPSRTNTNSNIADVSGRLDERFDFRDVHGIWKEGERVMPRLVLMLADVQDDYFKYMQSLYYDQYASYTTPPVFRCEYDYVLPHLQSGGSSILNGMYTKEVGFNFQGTGAYHTWLTMYSDAAKYGAISMQTQYSPLLTSGELQVNVPQVSSPSSSGGNPGLGGVSLGSTTVLGGSAASVASAALQGSATSAPLSGINLGSGATNFSGVGAANTNLATQSALAQGGSNFYLYYKAYNLINRDVTQMRNKTDLMLSTTQSIPEVYTVIDGMPIVRYVDRTLYRFLVDDGQHHIASKMQHVRTIPWNRSMLIHDQNIPPVASEFPVYYTNEYHVIFKYNLPPELAGGSVSGSRTTKQFTLNHVPISNLGTGLH